MKSPFFQDTLFHGKRTRLSVQDVDFSYGIDDKAMNRKRKSVGNIGSHANTNRTPFRSEKETYFPDEDKEGRESTPLFNA